MRRARGMAALPAVLAALGALAGSASASVDLANAPGVVKITGQTDNDRAGASVAVAGDVNGDGRPDLIVGASNADNNSKANSGSAYVVYGGQNLANVSL